MRRGSTPIDIFNGRTCSGVRQNSTSSNAAVTTKTVISSNLYRTGSSAKYMTSVGCAVTEDVKRCTEMRHFQITSHDITINSVTVISPYEHIHIKCNAQKFYKITKKYRTLIYSTQIFLMALVLCTRTKTQTVNSEHHLCGDNEQLAPS